MANYTRIRILPSGMRFPSDFGSIPRPLAEDGNALGVTMIGETPSFPECLLNVCLIGIICAEQTENERTIRNDRLLGGPITSVNAPAYRHIDSLPTDLVDQLKAFSLPTIAHTIDSLGRFGGADRRKLNVPSPRPNAVFRNAYVTEPKYA